MCCKNALQAKKVTLAPGKPICAVRKDPLIHEIYVDPSFGTLLGFGVLAVFEILISLGSLGGSRTASRSFPVVKLVLNQNLCVIRLL